MLRPALPRAVAALALFGLMAASVSQVSAQPAETTGGGSGEPVGGSPHKKKVLTYADYDIWRTTSAVTLSHDGKYVAYLIGAENVDGEAVVRNVASGKEYRFPRGAVGALAAAPKFTPDGRRVLLPLAPTKAEVDKAKADKLKADEMPKPALAIVDLATGTESEKISGVGTFQVAGEGAGFLIFRKPAPAPETNKTDTTAAPGKGPGKGTGKGPGKGATKDGPATPDKTGSDLYIRDLTSTVDRTIANVTEFSLSNDEKTLVYVVAAKNEEKNGVYALNPRFGTAAVPLKAGPGRYSGLTWDEKQGKLAFFYDDSTVPSDTVAPPPRPAGTPVGTTVAAPAGPPVPPRWRVFVWDRVARSEPAQAARVPLGAASAGFGGLVATAVSVNAPFTHASALAEVFSPATLGLKKGWALQTTGLSFSQDGTKVFVSTAPERPAASSAVVTDDIQLDIWHWKDAAIQPMQKIRAAADRNKTYGAVVLLDTKEFRHLSDDALTVQQPATGDWAIATDDSKYRHMTGYASPVPSDHALVNIRTGEKKLVLTAAGFGVNLSPNGKFLLGFDGKDWVTFSVPDGKKTNLTSKLPVKFFDEDHDSPSEPGPYGTGQWTTDGQFVLVSDRFDIWKLAADGSGAENLTKTGRTQGIRFTLLRPRSPEERTVERGIDLAKPLLLGAHNRATHDTGFYRLEPGAAPKLLLMGARAYGAPTKAKDADVYLLTVQTFSQYPDYYVTTPDFHELRRVTDINPKVKDYNWGTAVLIQFSSTDGDKLSGVLIKPENFDPTKKYPMVVYIYERLSDSLHQFRVPNVVRGQVINPTFYASNGYLVLMPDIAYKIGQPGQSALKCVLPAVQAVVDKGYVNERAIGINGQSWGGYQIAYMVTQTNRFRAAVAGAPVANMVSAYDGIRWGTGLPRQFQYEKTQSRIGATLWEAPMKFIENSPVFAADRVQTPLLMIHNDQDDAVPWYQGIEYFLALRRLGKEAYLLNYNGEPHNLAKKAPARDFAMRMFQFFEHHLKDKPAPEWMEKGVPYLDREKEKEQWKKLNGTGK
ncbi:Acylamino-acid-releasing enzyme [Frigoriglobus tundricola]|uniref:Acylamino-acid-releasing enzyme n=1 Tax=Frigoriglobus tundricola TaxID=2774151 RepID=A0A6M5Z2X8_9BACT|nr:Acylamino-acid-releasing enzyme [Frigoriglobus tundricola]